MRKTMLLTIIAVGLALAGCTVKAEAKSVHHYAHYAHSYGDGRPYRWCGWYMAQLLGRAGNGHNLNLARNWANEGTGTFDHEGAVVVWSHHVGLDRGSCPGGRMIESGNDGNAVRTRCMSVARAIAFRDVGYGGGFGMNIASYQAPVSRGARGVVVRSVQYASANTSGMGQAW